MFPNFRVFEQSESVLLAQLSMISSKEDLPAPPPRKADGPVADLADKIEALLKTGKATTCSQAMELLAKSDPALIDRAHEFKQAVAAPVTKTAEQNYRQAILTAKQRYNLSPEAAQQFINRSRPDLREKFVAEHNERHAGSMIGKPMSASRAYWNAVQTAQREKQLSQSDAMKFVNRHHAALRQAMVAEVNG